jgi:hypothetical protein
MKKTFEKAWIAKHCIEVGNVVHVVMKANKLLLSYAYRTPFCGITLKICKFNMTKVIEKRKAKRKAKRWNILN